MPAVQQRFKTHTAPWAGLPGLALGLALLAPVVAWGAHALLGLRLAPGMQSGWGSGVVGTFLAWAWALALAPLVEESVMRPLLQTGLQQQLERLQIDQLTSAVDWRGHAANLGAALVFAALHLPGNGVLAIWWLVPALALGEVWRRCASLPQCALLHAWFNACLLTVSLYNT